MKSFLKNLGGRPGEGSNLVGRLFQIGPYQVKVESKLAEGGYASIFRVREVDKGTVFGMKLIRVQGNPEALEEVKVEARVMQQLRGHPHILRLHAVALTGPKGSEDCLMLLDICEHSLVDAARKQLLDPRAGLEAFHHVCKAVAYMHEQSPPLAHRDLKPENLLKHPSGRWVLCDFGSATSRAKAYSGPEVYIEEENIRKYTTPAYRAPEMWDLHCNERIDTQADIWSLGCMLYWLTFAKLAFTGESKLGVLNGKYEMPPTRGSEPVRQLIKDMLVVDPKNRPDSSAVLARVSYILQSGGSTPSMSRVLSADSPSQPDQNAQQAVPPPNPKPQEQWVANFDSPSVAAALFPQEHQSAQSPVPITSQTTSDHHADGEQNSLPQTGRYRLKPPEPLPLWNSAGESVPSSSAHDALQEPDAAQTGSAGGQVRVQQGHEPIVVAPSSAHLPRGGSDAGSGASTPGAITPRLVQPPRLPVEEAEGVEVVRRQLAEALAANAALQRRVAQLESMVRSQAATISALHSQNQQAVALGPHKKGSSVGCYEFGSSKRVSHATAGFEAAVRQETMVGGEGGFDPSDPFPPQPAIIKKGSSGF